MYDLEISHDASINETLTPIKHSLRARRKSDNPSLIDTINQSRLTSPCPDESEDSVEIWRRRVADRVELICARDEISQAEFARERVGISAPRFNNYKLGVREPNLDMTRKIAIACETHTNFLFGMDDDPTWPKEEKLDQILDKLSSIQGKKP